MDVLLEVIVAAGVLFAVGAFIAGRLDGTVPWPPDARPFPFPKGHLRAADVAGARFSLTFRGYRMADVDAALDRLAGELAARDAELAMLRARRETAGSPGGGTVAHSPPGGQEWAATAAGPTPVRLTKEQRAGDA